MYKIRFNLARGKYYRHWQIKKDKEVLYFNPLNCSLQFYNCILKSYTGTAEKIFEGGNRKPCAWLVCEKFEVTDNNSQPKEKEILFNPKLAPYWRDSNQKNIDNTEYKKIVSIGSKLYVEQERVKQKSSEQNIVQLTLF